MHKKTIIQSILVNVFILINLNVNAQNYSGGTGTLNEPFLISSKEDLKYLSENSDQWSYNYKQITDISFSTEDFSIGGDFYNDELGFSPIGSSGNFKRFFGTYDGGGYTIDGLLINRPNQDYVGLFGHASLAKIKNLTLSNVEITGQNYVGAVLGNSSNFFNTDSIINTSVSGNVSGVEFVGGIIGDCIDMYCDSVYSSCNIIGTDDYVGGVAGRFQKGTIKNSFSEGNVTGERSTGGLIGSMINSSIVSSSFSESNVSGLSSVGGLIGYINGEVTMSYATGNVIGSLECGGLVGYCTSGSIFSDCHATGDINGIEDGDNSYFGGLIGEVGSNSSIEKCYSSGSIHGKSYLGGLLGSCSSTTTVSNSFAIGSVSGNSNIGGLIGNIDFSTISNCYSRGDVSSTSFPISGFIGRVNDSEIENCYSTGLVDTESEFFIGGFTSSGSGNTYNNCFWDITTSSLSTSSGGEGLTTEDMITKSTYSDADWDFINETENGSMDYWKINSGCYPILSWQTDEFCNVTFLESKETEKKISLYPVPTSDVLNFDKTITFTITDISGMEIIKGYGNSVNVVHFNNGLYFIHCEYGNFPFIVE